MRKRSIDGSLTCVRVKRRVRMGGRTERRRGHAASMPPHLRVVLILQVLQLLRVARLEALVNEAAGARRQR
eukprot:594688-Prymnesium_polylepis.1